MTAFRRTLTSASDLADVGLLDEERAEAIAPVAARYAIAVTPAMAALIDPRRSRTIRSPASSCPTRASCEHRPDELADPIGDER